MERASVSAQLVLSDDAIWRTPHVVQSIRRGELRWDEFLRMLVHDLAFGMSQEKWVYQLLREGNVGLARELAGQLGLESSISAEIKSQEREWQQMVEAATAEAAEYIEQQADEVTESDKEEYEELLNVAEKYVREEAYGDAVSTLEQAREAVESSIERRRAAAAAAFAAAEGRVSEARATFAATKVSRFLSGSMGYVRARELLLRADYRLFMKDYTAATEIAEWVKAMCEGRDYPSEAVEGLLSTPFIVEPMAEEVEPVLEEDGELVTEPEEELEFELDWTREDDEYLIDNYDVLSNGQLRLRFCTTEKEIERRIQYLGLVHDRETGKRVRWRNPYVAGKPLRGKQVFVGRGDVFAFIEDSLGAYQKGEDRNLIVLLGHRRTGKTSILLQLREHRREIFEPRIPIFIDMEGLLPFRGGLRNFFWKLACCVQAEIEDLEGITLPRPIEDEFTDPSWNFQQFLRQAEQAIGGRGLVLMLDEFHAIEARLPTLDRDVYKMLRSVIQHDTQVDFILSGTMEMEALMRKYQAAMFGSAISKKIDFLDENDARKLIVRPVQRHITYSQEAVDMIVELTAAHPYFVQLVCWTLMRHLIDRAKSKVSTHDVERILPLALEQGVHFNEIWATDTTELDLYVMAVVGELAPKRGAWCAVTEIKDKLKQKGEMPADPDELDEAILNLTNRRIFRRSDDGGAVRFHVDVFGQWVNKNKPFEVVRRDIRAEEALRRRRTERQPKGGDRLFEIRRPVGEAREAE